MYIRLTLVTKIRRHISGSVDLKWLIAIHRVNKPITLTHENNPKKKPHPLPCHYQSIHWVATDPVIWLDIHLVSLRLGLSTEETSLDMVLPTALHLRAQIFTRVTNPKNYVKTVYPQQCTFWSLFEQLSRPPHSLCRDTVSTKEKLLDSLQRLYGRSNFYKDDTATSKKTKTTTKDSTKALFTE